MRRPPQPFSREIRAWAMFDFANSSYSTVVLTVVYNAHFVAEVAGKLGTGRATLLWTLALGLSNGLVILSAPLIGAIADAWGAKKRFLAVSTLACAVSTALLGLTGNLPLAMALLILSNLAFATGENLVAAFLPEIAPPGRMGRVSAFGWSLGYLGGLTVLALCLATIGPQGHPRGVAIAMGIAALVYGISTLPTFLWVRERRGLTVPRPHGTLTIGFTRLKRTASEVGRFRDLRWFLAAGFAMSGGTFTVIVLAGVYAHEVFGFGTPELLLLFMVLNLVAAAGATGFGLLQDRWGSLPALTLSLGLWIAALCLAFLAPNRPTFWMAAIGVGAALGGSQSIGRALLGILTPMGRFAEFYGLWGMTLRLAALVGPLSFGIITVLSGGNLRLGVLSTTAYFLAGAILLLQVDEKRGRDEAARMASPHEEAR